MMHKLPRSHNALCESSQSRVGHHDVWSILDAKHLSHCMRDPPSLPRYYGRPEPEVVWISIIVPAVVSCSINLVLRRAWD